MLYIRLLCSVLNLQYIDDIMILKIKQSFIIDTLSEIYKQLNFMFSGIALTSELEKKVYRPTPN